MASVRGAIVRVLFDVVRLDTSALSMSTDPRELGVYGARDHRHANCNHGARRGAA